MLVAPGPRKKTENTEKITGKKNEKKNGKQTEQKNGKKYQKSTGGRTLLLRVVY